MKKENKEFLTEAREALRSRFGINQNAVSGQALFFFTDSDNTGDEELLKSSPSWALCLCRLREMIFILEQAQLDTNCIYLATECV